MDRKVGELGVRPEGDYKLRLEEVEGRKAEKSGNLYVWWTFVALEPSSQVDQTCKITTFFGNQTGEQLLQELLLALGATKEEVIPDDDVEKLNSYLDKFKGKVIYATLNIWTDEKGSRNTIPFGGVKSAEGGSDRVPF